MAEYRKLHRTPLPDGWCERVRSAMRGVISLAQYAMAATHGCAANSPIARLRSKAVNDQLRQHVPFLAEAIRTKDLRMKQVAPHKRPQYAPTERMASLELRAARVWSARQTANAFPVMAGTIASWRQRIDEGAVESPSTFPYSADVQAEATASQAK